jgi:hypothetical protein
MFCTEVVQINTLYAHKKLLLVRRTVFRNRLQATDFPGIFTSATACVQENDEFAKVTEHAINNHVFPSTFSLLFLHYFRE